MATPKKKKLSTSLDCMIHCTNSTNTLLTLESMESWKTFLHAAHICSHQRILEVSKEHDGKGVPFVQYHRNCRSVFTMKKDLEKIQKSESERSTKKKLRKKIKDEFCTSATSLANNEERLIFLPKDLLRDDPVIKVMELQKKLNLYQQDSSTEKSLDIAAESIQKEMKS